MLNLQLISNWKYGDTVFRQEVFEKKEKKMKLPDFPNWQKLMKLHRIICTATSSLLNAPKKADGTVDTVAVSLILNWYQSDIDTLGLANYIDQIEDDQLHDLFVEEYSSFEKILKLTKQDSTNKDEIFLIALKLVESTRTLEKLFGE